MAQQQPYQGQEAANTAAAPFPGVRIRDLEEHAGFRYAGGEEVIQPLLGVHQVYQPGHHHQRQYLVSGLDNGQHVGNGGVIFGWVSQSHLGIYAPASLAKFKATGPHCFYGIEGFANERMKDGVEELQVIWTGFRTPTWQPKQDLPMAELQAEYLAFRVALAEDTAGTLLDLEGRRNRLDLQIAIQRQKRDAAVVAVHAIP